MKENGEIWQKKKKKKQWLEARKKWLRLAGLHISYTLQFTATLIKNVTLHSIAKHVQCN